MKVAIDKEPLSSGHKVRGVGFYTKNLIDALKKLEKKDLELEDVDFGKVDLSKYDLVHYPHFSPFFKTLPLVNKTKVVVTIHDLIPLVYPKQYAPGLRGKIRFFFQKMAAKNADAVITDSETSKKDIVRFLGIAPEKIFPIWLAPAAHFKEISDSKLLSRVRKKYGLPVKFVLYVGDVNYNKNIPTLLKACKIAGLPVVLVGKQALEIEEEGPDLRILSGPLDYIRFILGIPHPELAHYKELVKEFKNNKKVIRLGFVPDSDLVAIYNLATVYCQPSYYEGFGLPVLEAMASGTPVVAARAQALVEIGQAACLFADPKSSEDLAEKIMQVVDDPQLASQLIETGKVLVKGYSWKKVARATLTVYKKCLKR